MDWKKKLSFPVNYSSDESGEQDTDSQDLVVMRPVNSSSYLLADGGDGSEADLLGTTPPREIVRGKRKKKLDSFLFRDLCSGRRTSSPSQVAPSAGSEFTKKHLIRKHHRKQARDLKVDLSDARSRADSLPSPNRTPAVPTLVESCNRFMSLTSRLKCRNAEEVETRRPPEEEGDACRVSFHKTFSLLINMGSMEKGCKRTISREEQVWQNELKDLIWLELQAKLGGRSLSEQDAFLCAQRNVVPTIVQKINDYRFVNPDPCLASRKLAPIDGSRDDLTADSEQANEKGVSNDDIMFGCLSFNCQRCTDAVGRAMREVSTLLDSFYNATTLYQSSKAMTAEHPLIATQLFQNRVKAMCLWYNSALYMRLKMLSVRCMLRSMRLKSQRRALSHAASTDSELSRQSSECRPCQVRFCSPAPDSSNSANSDAHDVSNNETSDSHEEVDEVKTTHEDNQFEHSAPPTPETSEPATPSIVIDAYTTDGESGYSSDPGEDDVYSLGVFEDVTRLRLLGKCAVSVYREYHREILKTQGVRRCMLFMNKMRLNVLHKVYETLVKPDSEKPTTNLPEVPVEVFDDTKEEEEKPRAADQGEVDQRKYELRRYGCWSEETLAMRLPSYRSHFLLLSSICMEAVHDYLSLRLEDRPNNPSCLTVKQLIHELKEGLDIAAEMRAAFAANVEVALSGHTAGAVARTELLLLIRTYDDTVETVFKQYLSYLRTMSEVEQLSRWSLQAEWSFAARLARRVKCAATLAPVTFSEIACNQLNRILVEFDKKFSELKNKEKRDEEVDNADARRQAVFAICRWAQGIYASSREGSLQTAQWARALAARLARAPLHVYTPQRTAIFESLMSLRDRIFQHTLYILERSKPSAAFVEDPRDQEAMAARVRELLLQVYKLGFELHKELHRFAQAPFCSPRPPRPASLQPPRPAPPLRRRRPETILVTQTANPLMHKELHRFANDSRPALGRRITGSPPKLASRVSFMRSESVGEDAETNVFDDKLFENIKGFCDNQSESSIELLLSGEPPPPTYGCVAGAEAGAGAEERRWAARVARAVVEFAQCWMQFVVERCDKGRGLRPRWASQGLEFLMLACDPCNTKHLTDKEFEELKKQMDGCISHVIGSRAPPRSDPHLASPDPMRRPRPRLSNTSSQASSPSPASREVPAPPTPPLEPEPLLNFHGFEPKAHTQRVLEAVTSLERGRNERLRAARCVGHVVETAASTYEPKLRQLKFKWQRGLKIGAGTFGKVYTVVNTESGQLLAMKELAVGANASDRHALQRAANELRVLEGVVHPHLVRYYGCELHREEMLLFMELCVEGSLEALVGTSGALPEPTVRRYARQLLSAVLELHTRAIVHRDIKSGNIFLTNEGHCLKLGDFGCAVKIRANTTAAGELQGYVGTQAYMAPEVFMQSSGHGRAADIWSLGCVVTEMASGKRPWSEYDSNYQIMFVVGMGRLPAIPASLSEEGRQFCRACLTHEPELRPRAKELMAHHFLMVKSDDDCKCEPAYLIT